MIWASCGLVVGRCSQNCPGGFLCPTPPLNRWEVPLREILHLGSTDRDLLPRPDSCCKQSRQTLPHRVLGGACTRSHPTPVQHRRTQ